MIIYLNNHKYCYINNSSEKSSGIVMAFYFTVLFPIAYFCTRVGFLFRSFLYIHRIVSYLCIRDLLSSISFTLNNFILST
jgi:hypothetical protein